MSKISVKSFLKIVFYSVCFMFGIIGGKFIYNKYYRDEQFAKECKLMESRAIQGCEQAALQLLKDATSAERQVNYLKGELEVCIEERYVWERRANECASLLQGVIKE